MIGNEEDLTACLGLDMAALDERISSIDARIDKGWWRAGRAIAADCVMRVGWVFDRPPRIMAICPVVPLN